jgi:hypothetical protein
MIGLCLPGQGIGSCTGGNNLYTVGEFPACKAGVTPGFAFEITCSSLGIQTCPFVCLFVY